jgi:hypothetical protein
MHRAQRLTLDNHPKWYQRVIDRVRQGSDSLQRHFGVSPPSVHQMIVTSKRNGFIRRQSGVPRSIKILVPPESLPILEWLGIKTSKSLR